jgi:hypothetical protein
VAEGEEGTFLQLRLDQGGARCRSLLSPRVDQLTFVKRARTLSRQAKGSDKNTGSDASPWSRCRGVPSARVHACVQQQRHRVHRQKRGRTDQEAGGKRGLPSPKREERGRTGQKLRRRARKGDGASSKSSPRPSSSRSSCSDETGRRKSVWEGLVNMLRDEGHAPDHLLDTGKDGEVGLPADGLLQK